MGRKLTVVARLDVRSPCDASWDEMAPRAQGRHCGTCDRVVHEVADMTRAEAIALAQRLDRGERVCRRIHRRRSDGAIWTAEGYLEPERERPRTLLVMATVGAAAAALGACAAPAASTANAHAPAPLVVEPLAVPPAEPPEIAAATSGTKAPPPPEAEVQKILVERYPRGEAPDPFAVAPKLPKAPSPPPPPAKDKPGAKKAVPGKKTPPPDDTDVLGGY